MAFRRFQKYYRRYRPFRSFKRYRRRRSRSINIPFFKWIGQPTKRKWIILGMFSGCVIFAWLIMRGKAPAFRKMVKQVAGSMDNVIQPILMIGKKGVGGDEVGGDEIGGDYSEVGGDYS